MRDRLAIFDLDGTLIDTMRANYEAYRFVAGEFKRDWDVQEVEFKEKYFGKNYRYFLPYITGANHDECMRMHIRKEQIYNDFLKKYARPNDALLMTINCIKKCFYIALVTTASRRNADRVMSQYMKEIQFDIVITAEDVSEFKPNMEAWNKAMNLFNIPPERTMVFDDIKEYTDVAAAQGMTAFQVESF